MRAERGRRPAALPCSLLSLRRRRAPPSRSVPQALAGCSHKSKQTKQTAEQRSHRSEAEPSRAKHSLHSVAAWFWLRGGWAKTLGMEEKPGAPKKGAIGRGRSNTRTLRLRDLCLSSAEELGGLPDDALRLRGELEGLPSLPVCVLH